MRTYRTTKAVIVDNAGNVLLLRRSGTHPTQPLQFDLPGGLVEDGEEPPAALQREIEEETGLHLKLGQLELRYAEAGRDDEWNAVRLAYVIQLKTSKPEITISWEHDQYRWLPAAEALQQLNPDRYKYRALGYLLKHKLLN